MFTTLLLASILTGATPAPPAAANVVVAEDGSGNYTTVQAGIDAVSAGDTITVKPGAYHEVIDVPAARPSHPPRRHRRSRGRGHRLDNASARRSPTARPTGPREARQRRSPRTASPRRAHLQQLLRPRGPPRDRREPAVAVKTTADRLVFDHVRFLGHQDTLYADTAANARGRQYYGHSRSSATSTSCSAERPPSSTRTITALDRGSTRTATCPRPAPGGQPVRLPDLRQQRHQQRGERDLLPGPTVAPGRRRQRRRAGVDQQHGPAGRDQADAVDRHVGIFLEGRALLRVPQHRAGRGNRADRPQLTDEAGRTFPRSSTWPAATDGIPFH